VIDYVQSNRALLSIVLIALWVALSATVFKHALWLLPFSNINIIFTFMILLLALLPLGQKPLGERAKRLPFSQYLGLILLAQSVLLLLSVTVGLAFIPITPSFIESFSFSSNYLLDSSIFSQGIFWGGIFPWSMFGLWALILAYVGYVKKQNALVANMFSFFNIPVSDLSSVIKKSSESVIFACNLLCFLLSITAIIILLAYCIETIVGLESHLNNYFISLMILGTVPSVGFFGTLFIRRFIARHDDKNRIHLQFIQKIIMIIAIMTLVLVGCAYMGQWSIAYFHNIQARMPFLYKTSR